MIGLRLALAAIALMAVATAGIGGLAILDDRSCPDGAPPLRLIAADDSSFWRAVASGAQAAAKDRGVELQVEWPRKESSNESLAAVAGERSNEMVGTLCGRHALMGDTLLAAEIMRSLPRALNNAGSCGGGIVLDVTMANYSAGQLCAETAVDALPSGGTIAVLMEANPSKSAAGRFDGFRHYLRTLHAGGEGANSSEISVVVHRVDRQSPARLRQIAEEVQGEGGQLVIDFTNAAVEPLLRAFDAASSADRPRVIAFDSSDRALEAIETGDLFAIVTPDPFQCGYQAVSRVSFLQQRGFIEHPANGRGSILLPPLVVRQGGVAEFRSSRRSGVHAQ